MDIQRAVNHLVLIGSRLPYGVMPGSFPGGLDSEFSEERWLAYRFDPPQELAHLPEFSEPDPDASAKFSWRQIVWADRVAEIEEARADFLRQLDKIATAHIAGLYHPDAARDRNKEWQARLSGADFADKDVKRLRIIKAYGGFKAEIEAASTLAELTEIEVRRDAAGLRPG